MNPYSIYFKWDMSFSDSISEKLFPFKKFMPFSILDGFVRTIQWRFIFLETTVCPLQCKGRYQLKVFNNYKFCQILMVVEYTLYTSSLANPEKKKTCFCCNNLRKEERFPRGKYPIEKALQLQCIMTWSVILRICKLNSIYFVKMRMRFFP